MVKYVSGVLLKKPTTCVYVIWFLCWPIFLENHFLRMKATDMSQGCELFCDRGWVMEYPDQGAEALCGKMAKSLYKRQDHAFFLHTRGGTMWYL